MTNIRLSQEAIEVLLTRFPNLRVSQVAIEVLASFLNVSNIRTSQLAVEVLVSITAPIPPEGRVLGPPVQMI